MTKLLCGCLILLSISIPTIAKEKVGWKLRKDSVGILVYSRKSENRSYEEFKATVDVEANLANSLALLNDPEACRKWLHRCKESHLVVQVTPTEKFFYQVTSLPFPAKSRDSIFHATISFDKTKTITIHIVARPEKLPQTKHVRVLDAYGTYILEAISDSQTRITWQQYVDPTGSLPAWLVNSMLTDLPFESLKSFRDLVRKRPYNSAKFVYDEHGNPVDLMYESPG